MQASTKPLTVAVCTYRRFRYLQTCLSALQEQTLESDRFHISVIDNSLQSGESAAFRDKLEGFKNLEYIVTEKAGLSYARNIALAECRSPYIAYLDDDAIPEPDWAAQVLNAFDRYPGAAVIGGKVDPAWESRRPEWLTDEFLPALAVVDWGDEQYIDLTETKWLVGANVIYRAGILRELGGFSENVGRYKDILLCHEELLANRNLLRMGYQIVYVPDIIVRHLIQAERATPAWLCRNAFWGRRLKDYTGESG